jgi:hypothetical protein
MRLMPYAVHEVILCHFTSDVAISPRSGTVSLPCRCRIDVVYYCMPQYHSNNVSAFHAAKLADSLNKLVVCQLGSMDNSHTVNYTAGTSSIATLQYTYTRCQLCCSAGTFAISPVLSRGVLLCGCKRDLQCMQLVLYTAVRGVTCCQTEYCLHEFCVP